MPTLATYTTDRIRSSDDQHHERGDAQIRLSPQEQVLISAGVRHLNTLSRLIWQHWASNRPPPSSGNLSDPLPLGAAFIARAALNALALKVGERLDAADLEEAEEHHLMNDLGAIQSAQENLASGVRDVWRRLPFGWRRVRW
jgi:hypothetical protein